MSNYDRKPECQHCSHYDELKVQNHGLTLMVVKAEKIQADLAMCREALEWYSKYYRKPDMVEIGRRLAQQTLDKIKDNK